MATGTGGAPARRPTPRMGAFETCALWRNPELVRQPATFEVLERIGDSRHDGLDLRACLECGLVYAHCVHEDEAWSGGIDAMYSTYVPARDEAHLSQMRAAGLRQALMPDAPCIHWDAVAGRPETLCWVR